MKKSNKQLLFELNVEEALEAAFLAGWEHRFAQDQHNQAAAMPAQARENPAREQYFKLTNAMGQSLNSMANGLEAIAHALDNCRGMQ